MCSQSFPVIDLAATGDNIKRLRIERGLTVRDLQAYFGFEEPQAIYKWQQGKSLPTVDNLLALSVLLDVPMEAILVSTKQNYKDEQASEPAHCFFIFGCLRCVRSMKISQSIFVPAQSPKPKFPTLPSTVFGQNVQQKI